MTKIERLKRALLEVREICRNVTYCPECPFFDKEANICPLNYDTNSWHIDDWKEDSNEVR